MDNKGKENEGKRFVLSDESNVNTHGFRIDLSGMDTSRFERNPVMLYGHDPEKLIGRWEDIRIEGGRLTALAVFDTDDELAQRVQGKVERGFLKGCSVGIMVRELVERENELVATRTELMEASLCAIPSDGNAIVLMDENHNVTTLDAVKLKLKPNITKMEKEKKTEATQPDYEAQLAAKDQKIAELEAKLAGKEKEAIAAFLDGAVGEGRISESEKDGFAKLAATDFDTVKEMIGKRETKPSASLHAMAKATGTANERAAWTYLDWMKNDSEGLKRMRTENPTMFEELQKTL